jgi:dCTP deaminase
MFLSNRDIKWTIQCRELIVNPPPENWNAGYDETSIDLHLDAVDEARIWDVDAFRQTQSEAGARGPELRLGNFIYGAFSERYLVAPPEESLNIAESAGQLVCRRGPDIIIKPGGFVLWTTREEVGTPDLNPRLIAFVNAKSTRARAGLMVHLTAPTINAGWHGKIVLEIANLGPFHLVLRAEDVVAQLTVATISSPPDLSLRQAASQTQGQQSATGSASPRRGGRRRRSQ